MLLVQHLLHSILDDSTLTKKNYNIYADDICTVYKVRLFLNS